jgi:hypothetical protein
MVATIETLREIVRTHSAKVFFFAPPEKPAVESLDVIGELAPQDTVTEEYAAYERPRLLVDMQTANAIVLVYDAVKPETQVKMDRLMLSKGGFVKVAKVAWGAVKAA